jgi:hypothetical protein
MEQSADDGAAGSIQATATTPGVTSADTSNAADAPEGATATNNADDANDDAE